ncbi:recombination-associated protein RdgC [Orrella sp. 11846]|uniref:recombination-associated protein RdgC n=1 Tax=Orrella sp. 11846 TaxID=3409913 RepID=UPI003B5C5E38
MWFKNLKVFRLANHWTKHWSEIDQALASHRFTPSDSLSAVSQGWVPPREDDDRLAVNINGQILMALRIEKKLLPATVVNQEVKERAQVLEAEQGYRPGRKQLRDLKEMVIESLMPRAFSIARDVRVWIDPVNQWLVIDAAANAQTEDVLSALGKSLHPYPAEPLRLEKSSAQLMTDWSIKAQADEGFTIDADSQWQSSGDITGVIRYAKHHVDLPTITQHVENGYQCTRLALTWEDRISFVLTEESDLRRIQPLDILEERAQADATLNESERLDADFTLMTHELQNMLNAVMRALQEQRD